MSQGPLISIITPAHNVEDVLAETMFAAQNQTYSNFEMIVVDDGSTDVSASIAMEIANTDPRFKFFRQARAGSAIARNRALEHARGEWIAFLDADDLWVPAKLEKQMELLRDDPKANFLFSNYWFWDGRNDLRRRYSERKRFPEGDISEKIIYWNLYGTSTVLLRRDTLNIVGRFDPDLTQAQDWDLWLRVAEHGLRPRGVWEPLVRYRVWPGNISANKVRNAEFVIRILQKALNRPQPVEREAHYTRALKVARAHVEFARARVLLDSDAPGVPSAILRGWRRYPAGVKWLFWFAAVVWPPFLGGTKTREMVHRKLRRKW
jgi:glycosyltransferase involved in cell wall biosynthesis